MRANWSAPLNYVSSKLSDSKKKFEILMKNILSTRKRPRFIYCIPSPGDWQDDVRSSLYFQIWCSCICASGLVVWSPGNDSDDLGSIPGRVNFLKFQIWIPLIFSHVQGYIYTHLDWNYHNHHSLVALCQSIELMVKSSIPVKVRMSWEVLVGDIRNCWFDWCSLKRPRPWWGVRSGWL